MGHFRTVRFPVNFDGDHAIPALQPPPTLGEHDDAIRSRIDSIWTERAAAPAEVAD